MLLVTVDGVEVDIITEKSTWWGLLLSTTISPFQIGRYSHVATTSSATTSAFYLSSS